MKQLQERVVNTPEKAVGAVNWLFIKLEGIYPTFRKTFPTEAQIDLAKKEWSEGLHDASPISLTDLKRGLKRCRGANERFICGIGEFIARCRPTEADVGAPQVHKGYAEACLQNHPTAARNWSHVVVYNAWLRTNMVVISAADKKNLFDDFSRNYFDAINEYDKGVPLKPLPPPRLPLGRDKQDDEQGESFSEEVAQANLKKIKKVLAMKFKKNIINS
jgi:hypothetical protein